MEETISIQKENVLAIYKAATDEQKQLLEDLFGKETFKPKDITERIKTFDDALRELGPYHELTVQWNAITIALSNFKQKSDILAYLKLRIITAALNEGWKPKFIEGEERWYGWYELITKKEYDKLTEEDKSSGVCRAHYSANAGGGLVFAGMNNASTYSRAHSGSRLAFKNRKLAEYAANQFIEIYADYCFIPDGKAE